MLSSGKFGSSPSYAVIGGFSPAEKNESKLWETSIEGRKGCWLATVFKNCGEATIRISFSLGGFSL